MKRSLRITAFTCALLLAPSAAFACNEHELKVNLLWSFDNNGNAKALIIQGIEDNDAQKIIEAFQFSQPPNVFKHIDGCLKRIILRIANEIYH